MDDLSGDRKSSLARWFGNVALKRIAKMFSRLPVIPLPRTLDEFVCLMPAISTCIQFAAVVNSFRNIAAEIVPAPAEVSLFMFSRSARGGSCTERE